MFRLPQQPGFAFHDREVAIALAVCLHFIDRARSRPHFIRPPFSPNPMAPSTPDTPVVAVRRRGTSVSSVARSFVAGTESILDSGLPPGFLAATAQATSKAPTIGEIRSGSLSGKDRSRSGSGSRTTFRKRSKGSQDVIREGQSDTVGRPGALESFPALSEEPTRITTHQEAEDLSKLTDGAITASPSSWKASGSLEHHTIQPLDHQSKVYTSGYIPPPKLPWKTSTAHASKAFWAWFCTPFGFLVTLYGLNVVAWGGMLFLLLCNASPAMCWVSDGRGGKYKDCNDINSPRRVWVEIDSQILNALFCVTGFGLVPWRFRDLWFLLSYRLTSERSAGLAKKMFGLRKLAGYYRNWFRLPGSNTIEQVAAADYYHSIAAGAHETGPATDVRTPLPETKTPAEPLTGVRAPPTPLWKVDFFIWCQVWNTFFQICLCVFM